MKIYNSLVSISLILTLTACGNSTPPEQETKLETSVEMLKNAKSAFDQKIYPNALTTTQELIRKFPNSPEANEAKILTEKINAGIAEDAKIQADQESAAKEEEVAAKAANEKKFAEVLKKLNKRTDEVSGVTFYTHKNAPKFVNSKSFLVPYIVIDKEGATSVRLRNTYVADNWLFIQSYTVKADDLVFEISTEYSEVKRDNASGDIWEWTDSPIDSIETGILNAIANSKKTIIRYNGRDYIKDRTVGETEKKVIRDILDASESMAALKAQ